MKNSQKGFVVPLLVAIIALLVIGGGVYLYENKKAEVPAVVDNTTQQSNQIQQANPQSNNTAPVPTAQNNQSSVKPSITILSPNGGENWKIGQTYTISFAKTGELGAITVRLNRYSDDGVRVGAETIGTTNTNTFSFKVPVGTSETRGNAGRYKIQVIVDKYSSGMGVADESGDYFSITEPNITQPSIKVLSPNDGETIKIGGLNTISWSSTGLDQSTITIKLNDESKSCPAGMVGCQNSYIIAYGLKNTGSYSWDTLARMSGSSTGPNSVVLIPGVKYKIEICKDYTNVCDSSNNYFTVTDPNASLITVLSPSAGSVLRVGQPYQITWSGHFEQGNEVFSINSFPTNSDTYGTIATVSLAQASCTGSGMGHWADPSTCSYTWTPTYPTPSLKIQVFNNYNGNQFGYSGVFSIVQ